MRPQVVGGAERVRRRLGVREHVADERVLPAQDHRGDGRRGGRAGGRRRGFAYAFDGDLDAAPEQRRPHHLDALPLELRGRELADRVLTDVGHGSGAQPQPGGGDQEVGVAPELEARWHCGGGRERGFPGHRHRRRRCSSSAAVFAARSPFAPLPVVSSSSAASVQPGRGRGRDGALKPAEGRVRLDDVLRRDLWFYVFLSGSRLRVSTGRVIPFRFFPPSSFP